MTEGPHPYRRAPEGSVAAGEPRTIPFGPLLLGAGVGVLATVGANAIASLAPQRAEAKRSADGDGVARVLEQLGSVDLAPCRRPKNPVGPGLVRMTLGRAHPSGLRLRVAEQEPGKFAADFENTEAGACVLSRLTAADIEPLPVAREVLFFFVVPPGSGDGFRIDPTKLALDRVSTERCGVGVARVWLALLPDGRVEPHILDSAADLTLAGPEGEISTTEIALRNHATERCVEDAYRRVKLPAFTGSAVHTMVSLEKAR